MKKELLIILAVGPGQHESCTKAPSQAGLEFCDADMR